uniref:Uncharacterized protein n=1 Tax=Panagrolaimus sp. JU765 TaxID=591449 RepID=A0AC34QGI2_9BILA
MMQKKRQKKNKKAKFRRANALFLKSYYSRNKKTLFAACKAVIFGAIFIASGFAMTVLGYFDKELATEIIFNSTIQAETSQLDNTKRLFFKAMQYIGPILMGFGAICLIVACVMTLESRDKHAEIIQDESIEFRKTRIERETTKTSLLSPVDEDDNSTIEIASGSANIVSPPVVAITSASPQELNVHKLLNVNVRKPKGPAPIAQADSIFDLRSISPQLESC